MELTTPSGAVAATTNTPTATVAPRVPRRRPAASNGKGLSPVDAALVETVREALGDEVAFALNTRLAANAVSQEVPALAAIHRLAKRKEAREIAASYEAVLARLDSDPDRSAILGGVVPREDDDDITGPADVPLPWRGEDESDKMNTLTRAFSELLKTAEFIDFFDAVHGVGYGLPTRTRTNPRIGLVQPDYITQAVRKKTPAPKDGGVWTPPTGHVFYQCDLTRRFFTLPEGAPVPALVYDDGDPDPNSNYERTTIIHPGLYVAGPEYVLYAAWQRVEVDLMNASQAFMDAAHDLTLLVGIAPEDIGSLPAARAFTVLNHKPLGQRDETVREDGFPGYARPAGWSDVASWSACS